MYKHSSIALQFLGVIVFTLLSGCSDNQNPSNNSIVTSTDKTSTRKYAVENSDEVMKVESEFSSYLYRALLAKVLNDEAERCFGLRPVISNNKTPELFYEIYGKQKSGCDNSFAGEILVSVNSNGVAEAISKDIHFGFLPIRLNIGTNHQILKPIIQAAAQSSWYVVSKDQTCIVENTPAEYYELLQKLGGVNEIYENADGSVEVRSHKGNGMYDFAKFYKGRQRCEDTLSMERSKLDRYR